jgi:hypothetical protein
MITFNELSKNYDLINEGNLLLETREFKKAMSYVETMEKYHSTLNKSSIEYILINTKQVLSVDLIKTKFVVVKKQYQSVCNAIDDIVSTIEDFRREFKSNHFDALLSIMVNIKKTIIYKFNDILVKNRRA